MKRHDYIDAFEKRTKEHIARVNKYAAKIDKCYPSHDIDKLCELKHGYATMFKEPLVKSDKKELDEVTVFHIRFNPHHPEYWTKTSLHGWKRDNVTPNGVIDATAMPEFAIDEMLADWCAMSEEFGNTPFEWFDKVNGTRWKFSRAQINYIQNRLKEMWDE